MRTEFRKIARARSLVGGTKWYLSDDCLLAAKCVMYSVEYHRFFLRDLESIVVWPSRFWQLRFLPGVLLAFLGAWLWERVNSISGAVFVGVALAWLALELALGPTARTRISTAGVSVDLRLANRTRRARKVLAKIDAAVRATRGDIEQPTATTVISQALDPSVQVRSEESTTASITAATQTNGS